MPCQSLKSNVDQQTHIFQELNQGLLLHVALDPDDLQYVSVGHDNNLTTTLTSWRMFLRVLPVRPTLILTWSGSRYCFARALACLGKVALNIKN